MKRIIYHLPFEINKKRFSASQIRPIKILEAFEKAGFEVDVIEGSGNKRKLMIHKVKHNIRVGIKYDFLYSESSTMPTLLTEKHHLPIHPFLDFSFFSFCKQNGIKIGLFYRDIYWCFKEFDTSWKSCIARYFYKYDLFKYKQLVNVLFVPSIKMLDYLPFNLNLTTYSLPSGLHEKILVKSHCNSQIRILYVGGIGEHYDLKMLFKIIGKHEKYNLTVCCRESEWDEVREEYNEFLNDRISIVHLSGDDIVDLYSNADIFCLFMKPDKYWEFAVPYKLFEAIGYGCPILASKGTWVADFIQRNDVGFVCEYDENMLFDVLDNLAEKTELLDACIKKIKSVAIENTWEKRVLYIEQCLKKEYI